MGRVRQIPPQPRQRRDPRRVDEHRSHNLQPPNTKPRPEPPFQVRAHVRSKVAFDDRVPVEVTGRLVPKYFVRQAAPIQPTESIDDPGTRELEDEENNEGRTEAQDRRVEPPASIDKQARTSPRAVATPGHVVLEGSLNCDEAASTFS